MVRFVQREAEADRFDEPGVRVGDDLAHAPRDRDRRRCRGTLSGRFVLGVTDIETEHVAVPAARRPAAITIAIDST
jgi:hypothetical protein